MTLVAGEPEEVQVRIGRDVGLEDPEVKANTIGGTGGKGNVGMRAY